MEDKRKQLDELKSMFADYQKKAKKTKRQSREDILKKYFIPRATKETFRILPPKDGRKHIEEAFFHEVPVNIAGGKKRYVKIYCPAHNDPKVQKLDADGKPMVDDVTGNPIMVPVRCPLCKKYKKTLSKQDNSIKGIKKEDLTSEQKKIWEKNREIYKEAIQWEAKKFYIVRGIDKGAEKDGVKFWRFKHNYKNQGVLEKLLPVLDDFVTRNQVDFTDPEEGTDLNIITTEGELNGRVYRQVSAITAIGKSKLHSDKYVAEAWLNDDTTWRDVFKPKQAPGITPEQYLELVAEGNAPYWDDTDPQNKHWVFPNHPKLEEAANTRSRTFDEADDGENFEQASDLTKEPSVTIGNIKPEDVGEPKTENAVDVGAEALNESPTPENVDENETSDVGEEVQDELADVDNYDDLPF